MSLPTSESPESHLSPTDRLLSPYEDDDGSSTTTSFDKPFDDFEGDGVIGERKQDSWWSARRRRGDGQGVLKEDDGMYNKRKAKRRRSWFNYCIFGGISGCGILTILFLLNALLALVTALYTPTPLLDPLLSLWGSPSNPTHYLSWYPTDFTRDVLPIPCHSHNDYWRSVPLFSALRTGCTSVEADVWLFDNELYVGHNTASLTRNRTFSSLYIDPLVKILNDQNPTTDFYNGTLHGVYDVDPSVSLTLLVDVKTDGAETWPWVLAQLEPLRSRGWLTFVEDGMVHKRLVTIVGTGNTPFDILTQNSTYRDAFFDAPLSSLSPSSTSSSTDPPSQGHSGVTASTSFNESNSFYASAPFPKAIGRLWSGRLSEGQLKRIREQVKAAHDRGLKARYWDTPNWPRGLRNEVWRVLVREGVDVLNVDDLRGVSKLVW